MMPSIDGVLLSDLRDAAVAVIAAGILADDDDHTLGDMTERVEALRTVLTPPLFDDVCRAVDVCPTHMCDDRICADDSADCDAGR